MIRKPENHRIEQENGLGITMLTYAIPTEIQEVSGGFGVAGSQ